MLGKACLVLESAMPNSQLEGLELVIVSTMLTVRD